MTSLVIQPTETAQWYALINEAEAKSHLILHEELESYLVFLLMRYTENAELADSVLGMEYLDALNKTGQLRTDQLRDVGDKCLLFSGLFPGRAEVKSLNVNYFVDVGQSAYATIAGFRAETQLAELYSALCDGFIELMDVLLAMRQLADAASGLSLLQAEAPQREAGRHKA